MNDVVETFEHRDATVSMRTASLVAIPLMIVVAVIFFGVYAWLWGWGAVGQMLEGYLTSWSFWFATVVGIVAHEVLHAVGWVLAGGLAWHEIVFGIKELTPYAHAKRPMPVWGYRIGAALPGVVLGLLPGVVGLILGNGLLLLWGTLFTTTAAGDALILWLLREVPSEALIRDHPARAGCEILLPRSHAS